MKKKKTANKRKNKQIRLKKKARKFSSSAGKKVKIAKKKLKPNKKIKKTPKKKRKIEKIRKTKREKSELPKTDEDEDIIKELIQRGKQRGFITEDEIIHIIPEVENNLDKLDELYGKYLLL